MKIFITGVAGFLGSHLAKRMIDLGHEVSGNDNLIGGEKSNLLEKIKFEVLIILYNLTIVEKPIGNEKKEEPQQKMVNNPNCLLLKHKNNKISRNEKCLVTGKKFKHCCGAL